MSGANKKVYEYFLTDEDLDLARSMAKTRNFTIRQSTDYKLGDPLENDFIGALGEIAFGKLFHCAVDLALRPAGDGGEDFKLFITHKPVTIDVKTTQWPKSLLVKEKDIRRCAHIVVLAYYKKLKRSVELMGWDTRFLVWLMELEETKKDSGTLNHTRPTDELSDMERLEKLFTRRTYEEANHRKDVAPPSRPLRDGETQTLQVPVRW